MQLTSTTDYAIRIVCYLAAQSQMISTSELSQELSVPYSYIPKITKKLKQAGIIKACEGIKGGYQIAKQPENISLRDVISCTESTMAISRCLEKEGGCSKNYIACCKVHQILLDLQNIYNNRLENVKISDIIRPGKDEYLGKFYVIIKVNLREKDYECIYSHNHDVYEQVKTAESYDDFIKKYTEKYICEADWLNVQKCLAGENLTEHLVDGCVEEEIFYRGIIENNGTSYVWMKATAILIIAAGSIYGKFESSHKEGEPDVVGTFSVNRDENISVVANKEDIEDREAFARKLLQMYKDDSFHSTKFSTDRGYATSIDINIYLWKEDIEDGESVMTAEYRPVEYGKDYEVVNNPDKFQLYIDGKEIK